jgi:hemin uptake protein HemP
MPLIDASIAEHPSEHPSVLPVSAALAEQPLDLSRATNRIVLNSAHLMQGAREVLIQHGGECYRLRHTRNDKLILSK